MRSQCLQASIAVLSVIPNKDSSHVRLTSGLARRSVYMQRHEELTDALAGMNQKDDSVIQARDQKVTYCRVLLYSKCPWYRGDGDQEEGAVPRSLLASQWS